MSETRNFIETPIAPKTFTDRLQASWETAAAFLWDQKWVSLLWLVAFVALMYWDFRHAVPVTEQIEPSWMANLPEGIRNVFASMQATAEGTWRGSIASLLSLVYWVNALLYIADRSDAFENREVVGFLRNIVRTAGVIALMVVPIILGLLLLLVPGILLYSMTMTACVLIAFRDQTIFNSIQSAYALHTQSLPGQKRFFGFSRGFLEIAVISILLECIAPACYWVLKTFALPLWPDQAIALQYVDSVLAGLVRSYLYLVFSIFVLRLYAEWNFTTPRAEKEST